MQDQYHVRWLNRDGQVLFHKSIGAPADWAAILNAVAADEYSKHANIAVVEIREMARP